MLMWEQYMLMWEQIDNSYVSVIVQVLFGLSAVYYLLNESMIEFLQTYSIKHQFKVLMNCVYIY